MLLFFPIGLLVGLAMARWVKFHATLSSLNTASFIVVGALVASAWRLPPWASAGLGLVFGISHGYENGLAMTEQTNVTLFVAGLVTVGYVVVALIAALVLFLSQENTGCGLPYGRLAAGLPPLVS
jgi:urease accessory protein